MLMAAQSDQKDSADILKEVRPMVDGLLKLSPNSWEGHKLNGDLDLLAASAALSAGNPADAEAGSDFGDPGLPDGSVG